jgi:hypothetical protein
MFHITAELAKVEEETSLTLTALDESIRVLKRIHTI